MSNKIKIAIYIGLALLAIFLLYLGFKYLQKLRTQKILDNNTQTTVVNNQSVTIDIGTKASEIYDALHGSWWSEDEQKAINAVLSTPKPLIPQLSQTYFALSGVNLKQDLQNYLSASEWLQISYLFN